MVRVDKEAHGANRQALVSAASALIRKGAVVAFSVQDIAAKTMMAAEVIAHDFDRIVQVLDGMQAKDDGFGAYVATSLQAGHRGHFPWGCPAAPLAEKISRISPELQEAIVSGLDRNITALAALIGGQDAQAPPARLTFP